MLHTHFGSAIALDWLGFDNDELNKVANTFGILVAILLATISLPWGVSFKGSTYFYMSVNGGCRMGRKNILRYSHSASYPT
jgi:hypothetical protein